LVHFDIGDSVNYLPVDMNVDGVTQPGYLDAGTYGADLQNIAGAQLDLAHLAHRSWALGAFNTSRGDIATFFSTADVTLPFLASDLSPGTDPLQMVARTVVNGTWSATATGARTATSIQATGLPVGLFANFAELQAGQPITPSLVAQNSAASEGSGP